MIAFLRGNVIDKNITHCVLDVSGIGYEISITANTFERLPGAGQKLSSTDGGGTMAVRAAKAIRKAAAGANRQTGELGTGDRDAAIHRLRIRFKKLRHALEFSRSLTPGAEVQSFIGSLKRLQDELGAHQDLVVHGERLAGLARADQSGSVVLILIGDRLVESLRRRRSILRESIEADVAGFRRVARSELERVLAALG